MTVENGKQFRILPNKRAFNKSAYQTLRSIKHSVIKRTIMHLLTSKASMFLNCEILFLFNYVLLMFLESWYKKSSGNQIKGLNLSSPYSDTSSLATVYTCVNACVCSGTLPALWISRWYKAPVFQEKLNSVKLAGLDKAITLLLHLKRSSYFVVESLLSFIADTLK